MRNERSLLGVSVARRDEFLFHAPNDAEPVVPELGILEICLVSAIPVRQAGDLDVVPVIPAEKGHAILGGDGPDLAFRVIKMGKNRVVLTTNEIALARFLPRHGTLSPRSKIRRRCDTRKPCRSGGRKRERRRVF